MTIKQLAIRYVKGGSFPNTLNGSRKDAELFWKIVRELQEEGMV